MNFRKLLRGPLEAFLRSAKRFPLTLAFGAAGACAGAWMALTHTEPEDTRVFFVLLACWLSVPVSFALSLLAEALGFGARGRVACALSAAALAALAYRGFSAYPESILPLRFALWAAAAGSAAAVAPLVARQDTARFRHFNLVLLQRLLATVALAIPLFLGLLLALWALRALFGLKLADGLEASLWFFVTGVFGTAYFTGNAPRLRDPEAVEHPAFLRALTRFILLPLSFTYLVILYAYVVRILVLREWPQGMVSGLILAFAATGIATHLLVHDNPGSGRLGRGYARGFYLVLAPLVAMLFGAIWRRHSEYGLTEERALVWVAAFWLALLCGWFLSRRRARLEIIPLSLGLVAFAVSVGPWSLSELSIASQLRRLEAHLEAAGRLHDGRLAKTAAPAPGVSESEIAQILMYLERREALDRLRPWFKPTGSGCADCVALSADTVPAPESLVTALGLSWRPYRIPPEKFTEEFDYAAPQHVQDIRGYAWSVPVSLSGWSDVDTLRSTVTHPGEGYRVEGAGITGLRVYHGWELVSAADLGPLIARLRRDTLGDYRSRDLPADTLRLDWSDASGRFSLRLSHITLADTTQTKARVKNLGGVLLIAPAR